MKKLLFAANNLDLGGIETALVTLLNNLIKEGKYEITLALESKQGMFLAELDKRIQVIEYQASKMKFMPLRKMINLMKRLTFSRKYKNQFDFSAAFATYSLPAGFMARVASNNCALWIHADYLSLYHGDKEKVRSFFESVHHAQYKHLVFVSKEAMESYLELFPQYKNKAIVCNNVIDYETIRKKATEEIEEKRDFRLTTFLNVGRHKEEQKKLTRLIEAGEKLKADGLPFRILLVGDGENTAYYKSLVKDANLENEIIFIGRKKNPYPYFKISDCLILTSDYEGYPVVFVEAFVLGLPIITTDISDSKEEIEGKCGYVTGKSTEEIYQYMKKFIKEGYMIQTRFDPIKFNQEQLAILEKIL